MQEDRTVLIHPSIPTDVIERSKVSGCEGCPLYSVNVRVPPERTSPDAGVLVVGEAPGMDDMTRPFSGRAGEFIRATLKSGGVEHAVLDNVVKCRAFVMDGERAVACEAPREAVKHCRPQLEDTIRRNRPNMIVALGAEAWAWFVPNGPSITSAQGRLFNTKFGPVLPVVNPASVLRTGCQVTYDIIVHGFRRVFKGEQPIEAPNVVIVQPQWCPLNVLETLTGTREGRVSYTTEEALIERIGKAKVVVCDLETTGKEAFADNADVTCVSFAIDTHTAYVMPMWQREFRALVERANVYRSLARVLNACTNKLVFHNASFDVRYLSAIYDREFGLVPFDLGIVRCTLIMHWMLEPNSAHDLDSILESRGYTSHKGAFAQHLREVVAHADKVCEESKANKAFSTAEARAVRDEVRANRFDFAEWSILSRYNALDAGYSFRVLRWLVALLRDNPNVEALWTASQEMLQTALAMEDSGVAVDLGAVDVARAKHTKRAQTVRDNVLLNPVLLQLLVEAWGMPIDGVFRVDDIAAFLNLNSAKQLSRLFFGAWSGKDDAGNATLLQCDSLGIEPREEWRNSNGYSTSAEILEEIRGPEAQWLETLSAHPWAQRFEDAKGGAYYQLAAPQFWRAYNMLVRKGLDRRRVLEKMRPVAAKALVGEVIEYRNATKFVSTFVDGVPKRLRADGRMHDEFKVHGTVTGRWASFLHTFPRADKELKRQFCSRFEGGKLVYFDQGQIEARVIGTLAGDEVLLDVFRAGADFHARTASAFFRISQDEVMADQARYRTPIKHIIFGAFYGRSAESLALDLISLVGMAPKAALDFATRFLADIFDTYRGVEAWRQSGIKTLTDVGVWVASCYLAAAQTARARLLNDVIVTPFGFELCIPKNTPYGERRRRAWNYPVQSTAGYITNLAAVRIHKALQERDMQARLVLQIHDAVVVDAPVNEVDVVARLVRSEMERVDGYETWLKCPLKSDGQVGPNLADMEKWS